MSIKGFLKDLTILNALVSLFFVSGIILYYYFTTYDPKFLVIDLFLAFIGVFGALARYRFLVDYVWTLLKKWW